MKENKGITIVALVITIVIMLILLGVTVTVVIKGDLIDTAKESNDETRYAQVLEQKEMWESEKLATDRFGARAETLEEFVERLKEEKILTEEEGEQILELGFVTIAKKDILFDGKRSVADKSLWDYKLDTKTNFVTITRYLGTTDNLTELTIPNFLLIDGKEYRVTKTASYNSNNAIVNFDGKLIISKGITEIGMASFNGANKITGVEIPDSVTIISDYVFQDCKGLTTITIPGSVKKIGVGYNGYSNCQTFKGCSNVETVVLEEGLEEIGGNAFNSCSKVKEWNLPKSLKRIGPGAFSDIGVEEFNIPQNVESIDARFLSSSNLVKVNVDSNNKYFTSVDGILFDKNITRLIKYPEKRYGSSYEVPNTVKTIDANAFISCENLQTITIADSVERIGDSAFYYSSLKIINLGGGITNISNTPFHEANKLVSINVITENENYESENGILFSKGKTKLIKCPKTIMNGEVYEIPNTVTEVGNQAFYGSEVKNVIIPSSVKKIGNECFAVCPNLEEINLQEGLEQIGWRAFYRSHKIKTIVIPSSVTTIATETFGNMNGLTQITIKKAENSISGKPWGARASVIIEWTGE